MYSKYILRVSCTKIDSCTDILGDKVVLVKRRIIRSSIVSKTKTDIGRKSW